MRGGALRQAFLGRGHREVPRINGLRGEGTTDPLASRFLQVPQPRLGGRAWNLGLPVRSHGSEQDSRAMESRTKGQDAALWGLVLK